MKLPVFFFFFFTVFMCGGCKTNKPYDSVRVAEIKNNANIAKGIVNPNVSDFFIQMTDACMTNIKEGELAMKKGTTAALKVYGKQMVKDYTLLLTKIKKMAVEMKVVLPDAISYSRKDELGELSMKEEKEFDKKFTRMMRSNHERDLAVFTNAANIIDDRVHTFVIQYLPMVQAHLDSINAIAGEEQR